MTPQEAENYARQWLDAAPEDTLSASEYDWELATLSKQDLLDTGIRPLSLGDDVEPMRSDLSRPVVVSLGNADTFQRFAVWDGVHRIVSALRRGVDELPAVIGRRKQDYEWRFARVRDGGKDYFLQMLLALPSEMQQTITEGELKSLPLKMRTVAVSDYLEQVQRDFDIVKRTVDLQALDALVLQLVNRERVAPACIRGGACRAGRPVLLAAHKAGFVNIPAVDIDQVLASVSKEKQS